LKQYKVHIGIDDTDSPRRGCTTYTGALIVEELLKLNIKFIDYPNLIRLNPNIPWKTRGNGAVSIRVQVSEELKEKVIDKAIRKVIESADLHHSKTSPAIAVLIGEVPKKLRKFSEKAQQTLVTTSEARRLVGELGIKAWTFKSEIGLVGALAAIGETLENKDYTYELLAYRKPENWGKPRKVDPKSVIEMDKAFRGETFNNIDPETGRILITPRGPDPVLLGIRGENPEILVKAFKMLRIGEPVDRWIIYRTNQGTDAHLKRISKISQVKPYDSVIVRGTVVEKPIILTGGHVILKISDETSTIDCAVYKPTGQLTKIARQLEPGDLIEVYGGAKITVNSKLTINVEKLAIIKLTTIIEQRNPKCPKCGKTMKSAGRNKGYKCPKCKYQSKNLTKQIAVKPRKILEAIYLPPPRAHRHLTKPLMRIGREKVKPPKKMIDQWYWSPTISTTAIMDS